MKISIDSRSVTSPSDTLFVALETPTGDGHRYISELYRRGVRNFIVNRSATLPPLPGANVTAVSDTAAELTAMGRRQRALMQPRNVVAITGSRGKTVLKELIFQMLGSQTAVARSPRSWNSHIGVPLALLSMDTDAETLIVEAGISRPGEMSPLASLIAPTIGIITNVTGEHARNFTGRKEQIDEKLDLFASAGTIIYNSDDTEIAAEVHRRYAGRNLVAVAAGYPSTDLIAMARKAVETLGYTPLTPSFPDIRSRLDVVEGVNGCKIVDDRFTPDATSLATSLDFLRRRAPGGTDLTVVLSTDGFIGPTDTIAPLLGEYGVSRLITVGHTFPAPLPDGIVHTHFATPAQLADSLNADDFSGETILLRPTAQAPLDNLYAMLEAKQHETVLEVNLDALVSNFNFFRQRLRPTTDIICMLKAAGYGAGSVELARTLQSQGAAALAVAVVDEGVELRRAGITMPIIVLNPRAQNMRTMFSHRLEPEVYSFNILDQIARGAHRYATDSFPIHIKLETGMSRLGFLAEEIPALAKRLSATEGRLRVASAFSHLACADDPADDPYTMGQFASFEAMTADLAGRIGYMPRRHILNSTGIVRFPQYQFDAVRLGIGLYGIPTLDDGSEADLRPVSTLTSVVISLKHWEKGRTIGYNRRTVLNRDSVIATIPVGYADGIDRRLGNGSGHVLIHGMAAPIAGNVCMDILMADVTDIIAAGTPVAVGDRVELFGENLTATRIAATLGTIPYEILTSISPRVKRVYYRE